MWGCTLTTAALISSTLKGFFQACSCLRAALSPLVHYEGSKVSAFGNGAARQPGERLLAGADTGLYTSAVEGCRRVVVRLMSLGLHFYEGFGECDYSLVERWNILSIDDFIALRLRLAVVE